MLFKVVSRQEFLDALQSKGSFHRRELERAEKLSSRVEGSSKIQLVWSDESVQRANTDSVSLSALPSLILIDSSRRREFLAWVWTYLTDLRPLTAYLRVLNEQELIGVQEGAAQPRPRGLEEASLGLILGEAATYIGAKSAKTLTNLACTSTYSYAMARALALGVAPTTMNEILARWTRARSVGKQAQLKLTPEQLDTPWQVILALSNDMPYLYSPTSRLPDVILRTCREIMSQPDSGMGWDYLTDRYPSLRSARYEMKGPRERRVLVFEHLQSSITDISWDDPVTASFICGFLASQIGPGTLDYVPLLSPYLEKFPTVLLWYGLCSGLHNLSSLYGFLGGLGRRVSREILRKETLFEAPQCDIALAEFETLTPSDITAVDFRVGTQGLLAVELLPRIAITLRWPPKQTEQPDLFTVNAPGEKQELFLELKDLASKLGQVQRRLSHILGSDEPGYKKRKK